MSTIFNFRETIQEAIVNHINSQRDYLSASSLGSPRAVGDAIEDIVGKGIESILGDKIKEYSDQFARRAMADIAFSDNEDNYYLIDVKTHRESTVFNMPNLTSVQRLARFYEDDKNYFCIMLFKYDVKDNQIFVSECTFIPIEGLSWDCLTIGALGWGQIQIANANKIVLSDSFSRKKWMLTLCDSLLAFYPKEKAKIDDRISYFQKVKEIWQQKP